MIAKIIAYSARNKFIIFLMVFALAAWGYWALTKTPLDALPDLSDTQVIIYTEWQGRSPDLVEDQITYPITSTLLAAPKVQFVRGFSFLGSSFIYVIFDEGTDIYEYELPLIKVGQQARIGLSYFPGKEFTSPVDYIYPSLASDTRTAKVRFTIPNPDGALKPQMFTNVEIKINLGNRLAVPSEAIIDTGVRQIAYIDKGDGYFEPREVTTGLKADELVEVTGGIKAGEKVASSANFLIDSEAQLKGVSALPRGRKK